MKKIKLNERSKILMAQYGSIFLLVASGWLWNLHWIAGSIAIVYGVWITAQSYRIFKGFVISKWKAGN